VDALAEVAEEEPSDEDAAASDEAGDAERDEGESQPESS
jgi:hypothetical protein